MDVRPDSEIVALVRNGNTEAYAVLVRRHRDRCARFVTRMLGSADDAEDVLQSAFVRAWRKLGDCRNPERFGAWLMQIVVNECRTFAARAGRREQRLVRDLAVVDAATAHMAPAAEFDRSRVLQALQRLPADQREAFLLKHVEELAYEEMTSMTGVGVSALKMRVKRACERLRAILEEQRDVGSAA